MSFQEIFFDVSDTIIFKYVSKKNYICNYFPNTYDKLKLQIQNIDLVIGNLMNFKIIFNNQYPNIDVSENFITDVIINNTSQIMKFNNNNLNLDISKHHYIIQEFSIKKQSSTDYLILTKIFKLEPDQNIDFTDNINILSIKKKPNKISYYDILYTYYYSNIGTLELDEDYENRYKINVTFAKNQEEDIVEFDDFIVNLYNSSGHLLDTSGNENDSSNNTISKSNDNFLFLNLSNVENYSIKVHPAVGNTNEYIFNFKDFFRLKQIQIVTNNSINSSIVKNNIELIQYKYDLENIGYSNINIEKGLHLLESETQEENSTLHKFQITTPNIYKCFKITLNQEFNLNTVTDIILIGDKQNNSIIQ